MGQLRGTLVAIGLAALTAACAPGAPDGATIAAGQDRKSVV